MRNSGKGGMQTNSAHYSIYCPVCGKPAARKDGDRYMHFTKKGCVWHEQKAALAAQKGADHDQF
jgi:endogenous inhibitor of DNA gyrase (YacG/DUF329 family)